MTEATDVDKFVKEMLADVSKDVKRLTKIPEEIERHTLEIERLHDEYAQTYKRAQKSGMTRAKLAEVGIQPPKRRRRTNSGTSTATDAI